jgi:hypothetical protein
VLIRGRPNFHKAVRHLVQPGSHPAWVPAPAAGFRVRLPGLTALRQKIAAAGDDSQNGPGDGYPNLFTEFRVVQIIPTG